MILIFHLDFQVFDSGLFVDMVNWETATMLENIFNHCPWGLLIVSSYMSSTNLDSDPYIAMLFWMGLINALRLKCFYLNFWEISFAAFIHVSNISFGGCR